MNNIWKLSKLSCLGVVILTHEKPTVASSRTQSAGERYSAYFPLEYASANFSGVVSSD